MAKSVFFSAIFALGLVLNCDAATFTVGDSAGWDVSADLQSWVANKIFNVGDVLLFQYSRYLDVNEVDSAGYQSCNSSDPMLSASSGNTSITLASPGDKYFISGVKLYCYGGMKLPVNVQGGNATEPAALPVSPRGAQSESPPSNSRPSNGGGRSRSGGSMFEAWLCAIGVLLCICFSVM